MPQTVERLRRLSAYCLTCVNRVTTLLRDQTIPIGKPWPAHPLPYRRSCRSGGHPRNRRPSSATEPVITRRIATPL